jgi:nucleoside-diphosphate-sugar epimerase
MHVLVTGVSGRLGSHTLKYLLARNHKVSALDVAPLPPHVLASLSSLPKEQQANYTNLTCDLTDYKAFERIMLDRKPETVIHLGAIPDPMSHDPREVHNNNVTGSYNVLQTAAALGVRRIVQASSVNATGLSYTPEGHHRFREMPVTEKHPILPVRTRPDTAHLCPAFAATVQ